MGKYFIDAPFQHNRHLWHLLPPLHRRKHLDRLVQNPKLRERLRQGHNNQPPPAKFSNSLSLKFFIVFVLWVSTLY